MATIESLDLATLTNNPQSIAEALEDVLEASSGNIASLKQTAESDANHITNTLKPQAQADADTLTQLVSNAPTADVLNLNLTITDVSQYFVPVSNVALHILNAWLFHKFVFLSTELESTNSPSTGGSDLFNISASSLYPEQTVGFPTIGYQEDSSEYVRIETNGLCRTHHSVNKGHSNWIATINGVYKIA